MNWDAIINGAVGAGVISIILKLIDAYSNRGKTRADAARTIVEGGAQAVNTMRELLKDYDKINDAQASEIEALKKRLKERDKINRQRDAEFTDLQRKYEDLEAQNIKITNQVQSDTEETQRLRNEYANAQRQIIKLEDMAIKMGEYVDGIITAMKEGKPLPMNGELLESVHRLKLSVEERRRLAGKQ